MSGDMPPEVMVGTLRRSDRRTSARCADRCSLPLQQLPGYQLRVRLHVVARDVDSRRNHGAVSPQIRSRSGSKRAAARSLWLIRELVIIASGVGRTLPGAKPAKVWIVVPTTGH